MTRFVGIDISEHRGCTVACIDEGGRAAGARCCNSTPADVAAAVRDVTGGAEVIIGIDSPRMPLSHPRPWYWERRTARWRPRRESDRGWGRHCEVVVSSMKLANPQWTPLEVDAPNWMRLGFDLFRTLAPLGQLHEVFPTASYSQLDVPDGPSLQFTFLGFSGQPKDMLDAYIAAVTVAEFDAGRGSSVGGGDTLGRIVLPRPIALAPATLLSWPQPAVQHRLAADGE